MTMSQYMRAIFADAGFQEVDKHWIAWTGDQQAVVVDRVMPVKGNRTVLKTELATREAEKVVKKLERGLKNNRGGGFQLSERRVRMREVNGKPVLAIAERPIKPAEPETPTPPPPAPAIVAVPTDPIPEESAMNMTVTSDRTFTEVRERPAIEWETVPNPNRTDLAQITLTSTSESAPVLLLNKRSRELLGNPDYISLHVSTKADAIAVKATHDHDIAGYKVSANGTVTASTLFRKLGFDTNTPRNIRMEGLLDGDMLVGILPE